MWTFDGTPEALMQRILEDLEEAPSEGPRHFLRDRAFVSLVGRYILEERHGPVDEPALGRFLGESAARLEALPPALVSSFGGVAIDQALAAETEETMWYTVCLYRSAIQVIIDDYAATPVPGRFHAEDLEELDAQIRKSAEWQFPLADEQIPSRLEPTHWWWRLPEHSSQLTRG
jgi:hypothetical protein